MRSAAAVLVISLIVPASTLAEPRPDASRMVTDDCALARKAGKTCVLDVPAEDIGGRVATADELTVRILGFGKAPSLVRVRRDFIPQILKTAEDL